MQYSIEKMIQNKAYELGYEKCGIIPIAAMDGYEKKLAERIRKIPESESFYKSQRDRLTNLAVLYPWAESVVVLATVYGKYKIPQAVNGHIAKAYLFDTRVDAETEGYQNNRAIDRYLKELGLRTADNQKFGIVGLRWAAVQSGLGIIRRNNFFYTESGSWVMLEAWLTDKKMELCENTVLPACPANCRACVRSCPTGSLAEPYTMLPTACISFLTTFGGRDLIREPLSGKFKDCVYGCDICQDACPVNREKWRFEKTFPDLSKLAPSLSPEKILHMDKTFYKEKIQPKFFYLGADELWKWKMNALNFMRNNYSEAYKVHISDACEDKDDRIRSMAGIILQEYNRRG